MPERVVLEGVIVPPGSGPAVSSATNSFAVDLRVSHLRRRHDIQDSPLWDWTISHGLSGVIVTDPVLIAQIAERVARYSQRGWWWGRG